MMRVRDAEDIKSLTRIGLSRNDFGEEEAMKYGFPLTAPIDFHAIDLGPMQMYQGNSNAVIAGTLSFSFSCASFIVVLLFEESLI